MESRLKIPFDENDDDYEDDETMASSQKSSYHAILFSHRESRAEEDGLRVEQKPTKNPH